MFKNTLKIGRLMAFALLVNAALGIAIHAPADGSALANVQAKKAAAERVAVPPADLGDGNSTSCCAAVVDGNA